MRPLAMVVVSALWIGAAVLVSAVVAPAAFAALPSRALAGELVGRVLPAVFYSGCVAGAATLALDVASPPLARVAARVGAAVVWVAACAAAQFVVTPRIERLRAAAGGPIDALSADAPIRIAFGRLHGVSVGLLGVAIVAALTILVLAGRAAGTRA